MASQWVDSNDCTQSEDDSVDDSKLQNETDALIEKQKKRWIDKEKQHQHSKNVLKASAPLSLKFIDRIYRHDCEFFYNADFDESEWSQTSEVERLFSKLDVRLYLSKYLAVQIYFAVRKYTKSCYDIGVRKTKDIVFDILTKLTHFDITDSTCCLILKDWLKGNLPPRDIVLLITTFTYDAGGVYEDICNLVKEYQRNWLPMKYIDEPYILGVKNAPTQGKESDETESAEIELFSECSDDSSDYSDESIEKKNESKVDAILEEMKKAKIERERIDLGNWLKQRAEQRDSHFERYEHLLHSDKDSDSDLSYNLFR